MWYDTEKGILEYYSVPRHQADCAFDGIASPRLNRRQMRLLAVAFCRELIHYVDSEIVYLGLEAAERCVDGEISLEELVVKNLEIWGLWTDTPQLHKRLIIRMVISTCSMQVYIPSIVVSSARIPGDSDDRAQLRMTQANLLASVVGPGWTFDESWRTDTAVALARGIYKSRDFSPMPILADALQDAGCDSETLLTRLRDPKARWCRGSRILECLLKRI